MVQRFSLFVASLVAVAVLVVGLTAAGVTPAPASPAAVASAVSSPEPAATPQVQVDTIYVAPAQAPKTVVVHKSIAAAGGSGTETEGSGD